MKQEELEKLNDADIFILNYKDFAKRCINKGVVITDEIIKLFEVWLNLIK